MIKEDSIKFADDRDFARSFVQSGGGNHPARSYLCRIFQESFDGKRVSTAVFNARRIEHTLRGMLERSTLLTPQQLLSGYVRANSKGNLPTEPKRVAEIKRSLLKIGWDGQPLL